MTRGFPYTVYAGNAGKLDHVQKMRDERIHNLVTATEWSNPKPGVPWALDNGAYAAWRNNDPFPREAFEATLGKIPEDNPPEWIVIPDKVAQGLESLHYSHGWLHRLKGLGYPLLLAVQDGMRPKHVLDLGLQDRVHGIFVGGTLRWKRTAAPSWRDFCTEHDLHLHIGRCGTVKWMLWAARIGADSIDSSSWTRNDRMEVLDEARRALASQTRLEVAP